MTTCYRLYHNLEVKVTRMEEYVMEGNRVHNSQYQHEDARVCYPNIITLDHSNLLGMVMYFIIIVYQIAAVQQNWNVVIWFFHKERIIILKKFCFLFFNPEIFEWKFLLFLHLFYCSFLHFISLECLNPSAHSCSESNTIQYNTVASKRTMLYLDCQEVSNGRRKDIMNGYSLL